MRLSENPSIAVATHMSATADNIFELITNLNVMASFGTEFVEGEWSSGRPGTKGSQFRGRQRIGDVEWETVSTVTARKEDSVFEWVVGDVDSPVATWRIEIEGEGKGVEVSYSVVIGDGRSRLHEIVEEHPDKEEKIVDGRLQTFQENMVRTLEGVRRRVENR